MEDQTDQVSLDLSNQEHLDELKKLIEADPKLKRQYERRKAKEDAKKNVKYAVISAPIKYFPVERMDEDGKPLPIPRGAIASLVDGEIEYFIPYCTGIAHRKREYQANRNKTSHRW